MSDLNNPYASTPSGFAPAPAPAAGPHKSVITRLVQAPIKPGAGYDGLPTEPNKTPYWLVPLLIVTVISIAFVLIGSDVLMGAIHDQQAKGLQHAVDQGRMSQEQADTVLDQMADSPFVKLTLYGGALLGPVLGLLIGALAFWIAGRNVASEEGKALNTFPAMMAVLGVAMGVSIIEALVGAGIILNTGSLQYGVNLQTAFGMATQQGFIPVLLKKFDLFTLWWLIVVSVGCATLWRVRFQKAFMAVGGIWLVYALASAGLAAAGSSMGG